ncbi:MAG: TIGR01440 family protein [Propionibacteriaceae bacterium]|nr:TIGR01440 family protein [Propionibacteriaceae bacterium]
MDKPNPKSTDPRGCIDVAEVRATADRALSELLDILDYPAGSVFVLGCSTSEICGGKIGTASNEEIGQAVVETFRARLDKAGFALAVQCCEHLNRALVVEADVAARLGLEVVSVIPALHAGGACALAAYRQCDHPVLVEFVTGVAGMDIGDTFIGMHIKHVAVPVRLSVTSIGAAHVTAVRSRPKLIGGERARYAL